MNHRHGDLSPAARRIASIPHAPATATIGLAIAGAVQALAWAASISSINDDVNGRALEIALTLLSLATTVPLGLMWGQPTVAAIVVTAACLLSLLIFHTVTVAGLIVALVVLYRLGRYGAPQLLAAGLATLFLVLALAAQHSGVRFYAVLLASLGQATAWAGIALRARAEATEHSAARQVIAGSLLEHTARGERARISRELHDVVAHHISMIAVQAETARLTTPGLPATGAQRFSSIGDTARAALTEMRRLLGVLREDIGDGATELRRPQPRLHQLNELIDEAREAADTTTRLIISGSPVTLDPGVELAAFRIIQEALTNSRRHAPGAAVDVELHYTARELRVSVRDNGPGPPIAPPPNGSQPAGHGLLGMRERAAAVGGSLRTARDAGGGFIVEAFLPAIAATAVSLGRAEVSDVAAERAEAAG